MKNLSFIIEYFTPEIGGLEISTYRLAEALTKASYNVEIITKQIDRSLAVETQNGFKIHRFKEDGNTASFVHLADQKGVFDNTDFICVFGIGHDLEMGFLNPILDKNVFKGIKIGTEGDISKVKAKEKLKRFDAIYCQNKALIEEAITNGVSPDNCFPVKNGLDMRRWQQQLPSKPYVREEFGIPSDALVLCTVSRLVRRKNNQLFLKIFKEISNPKIFCLIHGSDFGQHDGEEKELLEIAKGKDNIRFISPTIDSSATFVASDVFVSFADREGAPNSILEAIASGLPCILSDISGHRVYVTDKHNGFLIQKESKDSFINAVQFLLDADIRKQMSKNSLLKSAEFDISQTSRLYLAPFKDSYETDNF